MANGSETNGNNRNGNGRNSSRLEQSVQRWVVAMLAVAGALITAGAALQDARNTRDQFIQFRTEIRQELIDLRSEIKSKGNDHFRTTEAYREHNILEDRLKELQKRIERQEARRQ